MSLTNLKKLALPAEVRAFAKLAKGLDLGPIAYKLMHPSSGNGWTREKTTGAIARYLMFLCLIYLYPNRPIIPTPEIDAVWHQHILDTSKYAEDCQRLFGRFVHHFPYFGQRGESDRENLYLAFAETQALFEETFGAEALAEADSASEGKKSPQREHSNFALCRLTPKGAATQTKPLRATGCKSEMLPPQPADCEPLPLSDSTQHRPRVDIDMAEVWEALSFEFLA